MTIYAPQRQPGIWEQMLPQIIGQMAMAKFQQSLEVPEEKPGFTLGPGEVRFGPGGVEHARVAPSTAREVPYKRTYVVPGPGDKTSIQTFNLRTEDPPIGAIPVQYHPSFGKKRVSGAVGPKPQTLPQINKRIEDLQKNKLRIQSTGGISDLTLALFADKPAVLKSLRKGDTAPAIAEQDKQIKFLEDLRKRRFPKFGEVIKSEVPITTPSVTPQTNVLGYPTPESVRQGVQTGALTSEQGTAILIKQWPNLYTK